MIDFAPNCTAMCANNVETQDPLPATAPSPWKAMEIGLPKVFSTGVINIILNASPHTDWWACSKQISETSFSVSPQGIISEKSVASTCIAKSGVISASKSVWRDLTGAKSKYRSRYLARSGKDWIREGPGEAINTERC